MLSNNDNISLNYFYYSCKKYFSNRREEHLLIYNIQKRDGEKRGREIDSNLTLNIFI